MAADFLIAIGDIHGEYDMLIELLGRIESSKYAPSYHLIFLGDYVDRGPKSREVIEFLREFDGEPGVTVLQGNHEDWWAEALVKGNVLAREQWMQFGGKQTRASYGVPMPEALTAATTTAERNDAAWARKLPLYVMFENHVFVHAGVVPGKKMPSQAREHLQWLRPDDFQHYDQNDTRGPNKHLVFGHSVARDRQPYLTEHYTGIDTGACFKGGALSAAIFDARVKGGPVEIIRIERPHVIDTL